MWIEVCFKKAESIWVKEIVREVKKKVYWKTIKDKWNHSIYFVLGPGAQRTFWLESDTTDTF